MAYPTKKSYALRRSTLSFLIIAVITGVGTLLIPWFPLIFQYAIDNPNIAIGVFGAILVSVFSFVMAYLRGDILPTRGTYSDRLDYELQDLRYEFYELKSSYTALLGKTGSAGSEEIDIDALKKSISEQALSQIPKELSAVLEKKFATKSIDKNQIDLIRTNILRTSDRLLKGIDESNRRSSVNLAIGIVTTVFAAFILAYIAFETKPSFENVTSLFAHYLPRLTTIIFVEVFAFFFLRLYKAGLQEIKYFQNELTNLELQAVAIEASLLQKQNDPMQGIIRQLIRTERNPLKQIEAKPEDGENNLSVKDIGSWLETISKITGKN